MFDESTVAAITAACTDVTADQVRAVLTALDAVRDGEPVGTIVQDPGTGAIAVRVSDGSVPYWRVTTPDGNTHADAQPKLAGWTSLGAAGTAKAKKTA